jgi:hypothetical protein
MNPPIAFSDLHHGDLFESFRYLFEDRLHGHLLHPIGLDWEKEGFWTYADKQLPEIKEGIVNQYLGFKEQDGMGAEGLWWIRHNKVHGTVHKMITLEQFFKTPIDFVICSVTNHEKPFAKLCELHPSKPKLIRQTGNISEHIDYSIIKNLMVATIPEVPIPDSVHHVVYHPEFSYDIFRYEDPLPIGEKRITNLMNCLPNSRPPIIARDSFAIWKEYKEALSEFDWKMHGILGEDGNLDLIRDVAKAIREATFIWHVKFGGDGYGFTIHYAYSCGRPIITMGSDYKNKFAGKLLEDGVTCIDLEKRNKEDNLRLIRELAKPERHKEMCKEVRSRFEAVVDFNAEFKEIENFLENLL